MRAGSQASPGPALRAGRVLQFKLTDVIPDPAASFQGPRRAEEEQAAGGGRGGVAAGWKHEEWGSAKGEHSLRGAACLARPRTAAAAATAAGSATSSRRTRRGSAQQCAFRKLCSPPATCLREMQATSKIGPSGFGIAFLVCLQGEGSFSQPNRFERWFRPVSESPFDNGTGVNYIFATDWLQCGR